MHAVCSNIKKVIQAQSRRGQNPVIKVFLYFFCLRQFRGVLINPACLHFAKVLPIQDGQRFVTNYREGKIPSRTMYLLSLLSQVLRQGIVTQLN